MNKPPIPQSAIATLLTIGVVVPIAIGVIVGVAALLTALGDATGARILGRVAISAGIVWTVDLVCLLLCVAVNSLGSREEPLE